MFINTITITKMVINGLFCWELITKKKSLLALISITLYTVFVVLISWYASKINFSTSSVLLRS